MKVFKYIKSFREDSNFDTWLYRIMLNTCHDVYRKNKPAAALSSTENKIALAAFLQNESATLEKDYEKKELRVYLRQAIDSLSGKQRKAIMLKTFDELKIKEIAEVLSCSQSAVKTHLIRGYKKLSVIINKGLLWLTT